MIDLVDALRAFVAQGGMVMLPLVACALLVWYVLGFRAFLLRRGTRLDVRALVALARQGRAPAGLMGDAVRAAVATAERTRGHLRRRLEAVLAPTHDDLDRGAVLARSAVLVAPLLGLLGTVTGMIEMFESLGSGTGLYAQEGGIAKGISEALFTTELGLAVAIPGFFVSRLLERRAHKLRSELDQLADVLCGPTCVAPRAPGSSKTRTLEALRDTGQNARTA